MFNSIIVCDGINYNNVVNKWGHFSLVIQLLVKMANLIKVNNVFFRSITLMTFWNNLRNIIFSVSVLVLVFSNSKCIKFSFLFSNAHALFKYYQIYMNNYNYLDLFSDVSVFMLFSGFRYQSRKYDKGHQYLIYFYLYIG